MREYGTAIDLHVSAERHGKTYGMNLLAAKARAPVLIFTDANVIMDLACVRDFRRYFADPEIGCVCGNLVYTNQGDSATASTGSAYWRFEEAVKKLEMESGSVMGADGSLFAIRRSLHCPPPAHIIDDMYVSLMISVRGYRVIQASDAFAYEESVVSSREEYQRKIRIACQAFNVHRLLWPQLRRLDGVTLYKYVSHKLIRWFTIYLLAAGAIAFDAALLVAGHARPGGRRSRLRGGSAAPRPFLVGDARLRRSPRSCPPLRAPGWACGVRCAASAIRRGRRRRRFASDGMDTPHVKPDHAPDT